MVSSLEMNKRSWAYPSDRSKACNHAITRLTPSFEFRNVAT